MLHGNQRDLEKVLHAGPAIYDIHANHPALEAVLEEIRQGGADHVVLGGDVLPGPIPPETITYLLDLGILVAGDDLLEVSDN
jgi:hypothetical protein